MTISENLNDNIANCHIGTGTGRAAVMTANAMQAERFAYNASGFVEYHGVAKIGSAEGDQVWAIKKFGYTGSNVISVKWGSGSGAFMHSWTNHADASITYS